MRFDWHKPTRLAALLAGAMLVGACGGSDDDDDLALVESAVPAATGGSFSDDPANPRVTVSIPPGALSADAELVIRRVAALSTKPGIASAHESFESDAFEIRLTTESGGAVTLSQPMKLALRADSAPVHPTLGEVASREGEVWQRLQANFFRAGNQSAVALTSATEGTYRVLFRGLQATGGEAATRGQEVLMEETFGNEAFFGGVIGLHTLLEGVDPVTAVGLGVQVDINKLPQAVVDLMTGADLNAKDAALADPATTRVLLQNDAVIGVRAQFDNEGNMTSAGLTCALCHVTVTPTEFELNAGTVALPIGQPRYDGVPNAAIDAGTILSLTPFVQNLNDGGATAAVLAGWGAGNFDIRALPDNPLDDGAVNPTNNPPIWNFVDLEEQGYLFGWDGLFANDGVNNNALASQAEAVYDLVMHANGAFGTASGTLPPELRITPPAELLDALEAAETAAPGNEVVPVDKLLDLQAWMRSITSPAPVAFDEAQAELGFELFYGEAGCSGCHQTAELTGPGLFTQVSDPQGDLAGGIKVPGLRGVAHTAPYLSNGSVPTLEAAVDGVLGVLMGLDPSMRALDASEKAALVEYLKSL